MINAFFVNLMELTGAILQEGESLLLIEVKVQVNSRNLFSPLSQEKRGNRLGYEEQPTKNDVISKLEKVLTKEISREEFNVWAHKWVENFDSRNRLSSGEEELHKCLINLLAIDLEIDKGVYFHESEEIEEWIKRIKNGKSIFN